MRRVGIVRLLAVTVAVVLLGACGGGGAGAGTNGASAPVTFEARKTALDAVAREAQGHQGDPASAERIAASMRAMKEFKAAGTASDGSAWARFTDGRLLIVPGRGVIPPSSASQARPAAGAAERRSLQPAPFSRLMALPQATTARVVFPLGSGYGDAAAVIASWLAEHGYTLVTGDVIQGTVADFERVSGDGFFYLETHTGIGELSEAPGQGIALFTATRVDTPETDALYKDHLDNERLVYMTLPVSLDPKVVETHYAITEKFIRARMSFGDRSLVYLNACWTFNETTLRALIDKGAGLVIGWTDQAQITHASAAAKFALDRLLGNNRAAPRDPAPRPPLTWRELAQTMGTTVNPDTGSVFTISPLSDARLGFRLGQGDLTVLIPSVRTVEIVAGSTRLGGAFGNTDASVYVSDSPDTLGTQVPGNVTGTSSAITFLTPSAGSYAHVVQNGLVSNPMALLPRDDAFTKIGADGVALPADSTRWACVRHNATGLLWEAHVRRTIPWTLCVGYTNFGDGRACDAPDVPRTVGQICGQTGWRLPTADEARALFRDPQFPADPTQFSFKWFGSDDEAHAGWSSTPGTLGIDAYLILFDYATVATEIRGRTDGGYSVRLVR